jgi:hypothetical protein
MLEGNWQFPNAPVQPSHPERAVGEDGPQPQVRGHRCGIAVVLSRGPAVRHGDMELDVSEEQKRTGFDRPIGVFARERERTLGKFGRALHSASQQVPLGESCPDASQPKGLLLGEPVLEQSQGFVNASGMRKSRAQG